ncbi:hypothetical protein CUZ56_00752 [Saezia sanguinis]|uniref:N-acetyltransferase domain-containing protein n=1 Tax=Saezia sanguinis TaxID=1965230 RepID=A0A433SHY7_9BURK|nr:hypothetical protein CUZ56_00752 [Saezia sanguinis]
MTKIHPQDCEFLQWRSIHDEAAFFSCMGKFFASATVRRECGGYPLSDNDLYRWFIVRRKGDTRVLGFISLEQQFDVVRLRHGYLRTEARGNGLFRALLQHALTYVDQHQLDCITRQPQSSVKYLARYGFHVQSIRGAWVTMIRNVHVTSNKFAGTCSSSVL